MIAGGGTGGHLFPGIAVAEAARRHDPDTAILFVGAARGIETRAVPQSGFALETLPVGPLRGRGVGDRFVALGALGAAVVRARALIGRFAPDAVIGLGGYASAPAVLAGLLTRTPIVMLEQNARPGMTTRLLGRMADRVCVSFPETIRHFARGRAVLTGNPVRWRATEGTARPGEIAGAGSAGIAGAAPEAFTILVFGGSAGAQRLNEAAPAMCAALRDVPGLRVIHQSGAAAEASVRTAYERLGVPAEVHAFVADMGAAYAAADVVVCRAGATTVAEIAALGKPAILVPYPYAADDHQRLNAESLVRAGAASMVLDAEASGERLAGEVRALRSRAGALGEMGRRVKQFAHPNAAERVLATVEEAIRERRGGH